MNPSITFLEYYENQFIVQKHGRPVGFLYLREQAELSVRNETPQLDAEDLQIIMAAMVEWNRHKRSPSDLNPLDLEGRDLTEITKPGVWPEDMGESCDTPIYQKQCSAIDCGEPAQSCDTL